MLTSCHASIVVRHLQRIRGRMMVGICFGSLKHFKQSATLH